jgi:DNA-cytosine methyltransferase
MTVYYNDNDAYCCRVLRKRISDEALPYGRVDTRDIEDVDADEVRGATAWHLFAGIGGFPLGLAWAGWPDSVSVLTAGFPCQPASVAGKRAGMADERWVWAHAARLIRDLRPEVVMLENVPGLLSVDGGRAFGTVIGDLESCGYVGEWTVLSAADVGAPHRRERVWIVAHARRPHGNGWPDHGPVEGQRHGPEREWQADDHAERFGQAQVAHTQGVRLDGHLLGPGAAAGSAGGRDRPDWRSDPAEVPQPHLGLLASRLPAGMDPDGRVPRTASGIPDRIDRLKGLGNSVVPQCVEFIARKVIANMEAA